MAFHGMMDDVADMRFKAEVMILERVVYKSRNGHKGSRLFKKLVHVLRLCRMFLAARVQSKVYLVRKACEDLYILGTSNIPDGYFIGYTLVVLGISSRIHYLIAKLKCKEDQVDDIDDMFAGISDVYADQ
ncbi:hypothetical protein CWI42_060790 [Ordospora colligata]|uniref:Uncharacterized protein n=1 Tax=Ordospora colligata OC4 TaxID=1354746 RepID=A0A0B2UK03_9MICR|nr:uncharacterized protein M896_060790 [Ordospora colligata OC4]KHN69579.1 hypothetical protein M896_060790 [Ordospora colligata OC4]TBU15399.1 hypothetical protein CWI41_060780 [Ordospora colligata]TBU15499.1 hypothetical protein CWI40_060780 [Ordospora colligata]TBU18595.1 hypothetical protein CWI42_060790 [Ordospora colligata]